MTYKKAKKKKQGNTRLEKSFFTVFLHTFSMMQRQEYVRSAILYIDIGYLVSGKR
jgi:hypothetical protein